jgi:hypothetical protein
MSFINIQLHYQGLFQAGIVHEGKVWRAKNYALERECNELWHKKFNRLKSTQRNKEEPIQNGDKISLRMLTVQAMWFGTSLVKVLKANGKITEEVCSEFLEGIKTIIGYDIDKACDWHRSGFMHEEQMYKLRQLTLDLCALAKPSKDILELSYKAMDVAIQSHITKGGDDINGYLDIAPRLTAENQLAFPKSYTAAIQTGENELVRAKNLLIDYTKNDSAFSRFFHGHWNRHYVEEVGAIVKRIDKGEISDYKNLIQVLKAIDPENKTGSLARRISFLESTDLNDQETNTSSCTFC